ncbi:MAG: FKBP-type peptidyl-prolyl cis-trans isomerase [Bacteroidota bacterium]|nr:FKBP-type peptidyl-prolyl cis-trans isomerase [Bacteroidota bacterium]
MRQKFFTLLLISAIGFASCRKDKIEQTIKQYDESQMQNYIKVHGLTGMLKDTIGGDTSGIYYKIIMPGHTAAAPIDYPDNVSFVFQLSSFDGRYITLDTIQNHIDDYLGHLTHDALPAGLQLAIKNLVKHKGASARILIPSHLAYGVSGYGSGSSSVTNTKIAGNQCLDYYVHLIESYKTYDPQVIKNNWDLTGYTPVKSRLDTAGNIYYYKILTPGNIGASPITESSSVTVNYTGSLLNGTVFDGQYNGSNTNTLTPSGLTMGVREALEDHAVTGTKISIIVPSGLGYSNITSGSIPINSCLRFTFTVISTIP